MDWIRIFSYKELYMIMIKTMKENIIHDDMMEGTYRLSNKYICPPLSKISNHLKMTMFCCLCDRSASFLKIKSNQIKSSQVKSSQIKSSRVKSGQVKSSQIKSRQVKSGWIKWSQVKSSQDKRNQIRLNQV